MHIYVVFHFLSAPPYGGFYYYYTFSLKDVLEQGFSNKEIEYIDNNNEYICQTNILNCQSIIDNLRDLGLSFQLIDDLKMWNPISLSLTTEDVIYNLKENTL